MRRDFVGWTGGLRADLSAALGVMGLRIRGTVWVAGITLARFLGRLVLSDSVMLLHWVAGPSCLFSRLFIFCQSQSMVCVHSGLSRAMLQGATQALQSEPVRVHNELRNLVANAPYSYQTCG